VAHEAAERREAGLRLFPELGEGVRRIPDDADPLRARLLDERARRRRRREVAVGLEPDLDAAAAQPVAQRRERLDDPVSRRREVRAGLDAVAEHTRMPEAPSSAARAPVRSASSTAVRRAAASGLWKNERVSTHGTARTRVGQARPRLPQARPQQLGPLPERIVVLQEAELDAVVAHPRAFVDHARQAPRRTSQGREAQSHQVILSSIAGVTRVATRRPAKKRSRPSSTTSAIAAARRSAPRPRAA
jgi:hypothetical protein